MKQASAQILQAVARKRGNPKKKKGTSAGGTGPGSGAVFPAS